MIHSGKDLAFMNQGKHLVVSDSGTSSLVVFDFSKFLSSKELPVVTRRNYKDPGFEVLEGIGEIESTIDGEKLLISSIMCPLVMLSLE